MGVGAVVVDEAFAVAQSVGLGGLELSVWDFNDDARRLFEKKGFAPCLHIMRVRSSIDEAASYV